MRKVTVLALTIGAVTLSGCASLGLGDRAGPDEFAVARQAPLVIPPDFGLVPPATGASRTSETTAQTQALQALFGGPAQRSDAERAALSAAGATSAEPGIRSGVGDPQTSVIDKGTATRDILAAPPGDGQATRVATPGGE